jgi:hypothetical protein
LWGYPEKKSDRSGEDAGAPREDDIVENIFRFLALNGKYSPGEKK